MSSDGLKLLAEDQDDLGVVATALQDSVARIGDIRFESGARRLTLVFNRYRWEVDRSQRVRCAVQVGSVLKVQAGRLRRGARDAVVDLLTLTFEPGEAPGGALMFTFAGGGELKVEVECVDMVLADISAPWDARRTPEHDL